jgi:hypothetical protein
LKSPPHFLDPLGEDLEEETDFEPGDVKRDIFEGAN